MAIKSVMQAIATLLGIEIQDYNSSIASYSDSYADSLDDIADSADNATSSIKALKLQTLGFDQINNINESDSSSGGSSGVSVGGGGIDQRLLDAMTGYDNAMDSVRMKATEIRDKIMEWLGFTKKIDPLTKEISWQLNKGFTKIKLIGGVIATLVGIGIVSKLTAIVNGATKLQKILGSGGILTSMKSLVSPVGRVVSGIVLLGTSSLTAYNYMKNLTTSVDKSEASFAKLAISITGAIAGGALIGSVFGPMGIAVGAVTGTVVALVSALSGYKKGVEELAKSNIYGTVKLTAEELEEVTSGIGTHFEKQSSIISTYKTNISSLETEWNSSINTLEKYGATYGVLKKQITEDDIPAIISSIETLGTNTKNIIEESTNYSLDLWSSMMTGTTSVTKEEQANILSTILENGSYMKSSVSEIQKNITGTYQNAIATRGYLTDEEYNYISEQLGKLKALTNVSMSTAKTDLEMLQKDINSGRISLSEEGYNELITKIKEKEQLATDEAWEIRRKAYEDAEQQKAIAELAGKSAEEIQEAYQSQIKIADEKYEEAIAENQQQVLNLMETLESTVASKRKDYISNAGTWGQKLYQKITGSYTKIYTDEEKATINHYDSMLEEIDSYKSNLTTKYEDLATDTIDGYTNALEKGTSQIKDSTARVFEMVPATTQEVLDSHSPSKRFFKLGNDTLQGYINGLNDKTSTLTKTISDILKKIKSQFESVKLSLNINTNIEGSLNSILSKLETFANKFRSGINNILSNMTTSMNSVYVGGNNKLYYSSMPYISVPKFANGGFPEDGLFYANHNELVGQFANGKTAVANNNQIIEGIKQGVYEALRSANNNGINQSSIKVYASKDVIVETAINGINNITKQTGENPIEMW